MDWKFAAYAFLGLAVVYVLGASLVILFIEDADHKHRQSFYFGSIALSLIALVCSQMGG